MNCLEYETEREVQDELQAVIGCEAMCNSSQCR
jgi:hypothetical protein